MVINVTTLSHWGVMLMLFVIYACHLLVSIYCTNYFLGCRLGGGVICARHLQVSK